MTAHTLQFVSLSARERATLVALPPLTDAETVTLRIRGPQGDDRAVTVPPAAAALIETMLLALSRGARVAVVSEEAEVTANQAATILRMSPPLVRHRMEIGDLPFRQVGKHRRARLTDVLALKAELDPQREALRALAADAEDLAATHDL